MNTDQPRGVRTDVATPLNSWKEIGAYLQRNSATARRWEKEEGLPIHRHSHKHRSSVYAYPSEIDAWRASRKAVPEPESLWKTLLVPPRSLAVGVTLALCLVMVGNGIRPQTASAQGTQAARQILSGPGTDDSGSPSFDGRYLSLTDWATGDLAIRDLISGAQRRLTSNSAPYGDGYAFRPHVSRDGKQVVFSWVKPSGVELRIVGTDGSNLRTLYSNRQFSYLEPAGFSPDGREVLTVLNAANESDKIALVSVADGGVRSLKTLAWGSLGRMSFAPDGRYVAYDFRTQQGKPGTKIMLLAPDGSREVTVSESAVQEQVFGWAPDSKTLLFASERTGTRDLWALAVIDGKALGEAKRLRHGIGGMRPMGITKAGSLFYADSSGTNEVFIAPWDWATGKMLVGPKPVGRELLGVNRDPVWSRDGKYLSYVSGDKTPGKITIVNIENENERQLSPKLSKIQRLTDWSPDGRSLLLMAFDEKNHEGAYSVDVRTGDVRALAQAEGGQTIFRPEWLLNGQAIVYYRRDQTPSPSHVIVHDVGTGSERELQTSEADAGFIDTAISPDGRYLAFRVGGGSYKPALGVVPVTGGAPRELFRPDVPAGIIDLIGWSPDSRQVIFDTRQRIGLRDVNLEWWRLPIDGGERQKLESNQLQADKIRFHPDGQRIAFAGGRGGAMEIWALENFLPKANGK